MSEVVLEQRRGPALWITMNRPEKLNALSGELVEGLRAAFRRAAADDEVKVVVLTGAEPSVLRAGVMASLAMIGVLALLGAACSKSSSSTPAGSGHAVPAIVIS